MELFRPDNTEGYTQKELDDLNAEWEKRAEELGIDPGTDDYHQAAKNFANEVSKR